MIKLELDQPVRTTKIFSGRRKYCVCRERCPSSPEFVGPFHHIYYQPRESVSVALFHLSSE